MSTFALISDLHSNLPALTAVFERIDELGVQEINCLGDVVGYGAEPDPCVRLVMNRCKWTLMGNHDWGLFNDPNQFNLLAAEALDYTRKVLRPSLFSPRKRGPWRFLQNLPDRMADHGFLFFHGSPRNPIMEYVLRSDEHFDPEKLYEIFQLIDRPTFVGHTHFPGITRADYRFTAATDEVRSFELDGPCVVNVGSVGQPRDGDPRACFAVVTDQVVEIHRVPYDYHKTQAKILAAGLHPALADRLGRGQVMAEAAVSLVVCTVPEAEARPLVDRLLEERFIACANLVGPVESRYRWEGRVEVSAEVVLLMKTTAPAALRRRIVELHSYEVPEVLEFASTGGLATYLEWVRASCGPAD